MRASTSRVVVLAALASLVVPAVARAAPSDAPAAAEERSASPALPAATVSTAGFANAAFAPSSGLVAAPLMGVAAPSLAVPAPRAAHRSLAHRWWFWAAIGTVAVGVVIAGLVLGPPQDYSGNTSPGILTAF